MSELSPSAIIASVVGHPLFQGLICRRHWGHVIASGIVLFLLKTEVGRKGSPEIVGLLTGGSRWVGGSGGGGGGRKMEIVLLVCN